MKPIAKLIPLFAIFAIAGSAFYLFTKSVEELPLYTLERGRLIFTPGEFVYPPDDPGKNGQANNIHDCDPETAAVIPYPAVPPEGSYILMDLALSHYPGANGDRPRARKSALLRFYNGACTNCTEDKFQSYPRIKRARIEILKRRANDPDVEYVHPPVEKVLEWEQTFPDRPGPFDMALHLPPWPESARYPENVSNILVKLTVLEIYPGTKFNDRVAITEMEYADTPAGGGPLHFWRKESGCAY